MMTVTFAIASGGTVSDTPSIPAGYRLIGLEIPAVDSATLTISLSADNSTFRATAGSDGTANGAIGGAANTGDKFVALPEALSLMTEGHHVKITMGAAQNGGARTIKGLCARTRSE
jgi:hypothetical protein